MEDSKSEAGQTEPDILNEASDLREKVNTGLKKKQSELKELNKLIDASKEDLLALMDVRRHLSKVRLSGNLAAELAKSASGIDVAGSITSAAKAINVALDTIDKTYPEAMAMYAREISVDDIDSDETKSMVEKYTQATKKAAEMAEIARNMAVTIALKTSEGELKIKEVISESGITDVPAKIQVVSGDLETTINDKQELLDKATVDFGATLTG